jgi:tetratricopeptide (TPR) repeat protein
MLGPLNSARAVFAVAVKMAAGELAARRGRHAEAAKLLAEAVAAEDALNYDEPPPWPQPARQSLGAVLLKAGRFKEAEAVFREDLARNPENGWSLRGLSLALAKRGSSEAEEARRRFEKAWSRADVQLSTSRF